LRASHPEYIEGKQKEGLFKEKREKRKEKKVGLFKNRRFAVAKEKS